MFKYNEGDFIGPNKILMIKRTKKNNAGQWMAEFECPFCKNHFEARINAVTSGDKKTCGCRKGNSKDITNQRFGRLVALYPTDKRTSSGIVFWHCKCDCGNEKDIRVTTLLNGGTLSCGCYRADLKANNLINQRFGNLIALENTKNKDNAGYFIWKCKCNCGNECYVNSRSLVSGNTKSCGLCNNISLMEDYIANILDKLKIEYIRQKTFENCRNPNTNFKLKFDFYIPRYNYCIEYDGEQHSKPIDYFGGEYALNNTKFRDDIKTKYCQDNNIKLIRINYLEKELINEDFILNKLTTDE